MLGRIALLIGMFAVPAFALMLGGRVRDQTPARRQAFWGAVIGHSAGMILAVCAALYPPIIWEEGPAFRDFLVYWSMLIGSIVGAVVVRLWGRT